MNTRPGEADGDGRPESEPQKPDAPVDASPADAALMDSSAGSKNHSADTKLKLCKLPNGMEVAYQSKVEVEHFFEDIFEKQIYVKNGLSIRPGDCIFDVGANIGLFTLFAHTHFHGVETYSFEPAPPLFEILSTNAALHKLKANLFNFGISDVEKTAEFTFYPNSSGMSSFYADLKEEKEVLRSIMVNQMRKGIAGMEQLMKHADDLLEERFRSQTYECRLTTLSRVMREHHVKQIDLLKIDVQKSELDVLRGIEEGDWERIRQIVIEVHDIDGRVDEISTMLAGRGFRLVVEQDDMYEDSPMFNLYAIKHDETLASGTVHRAQNNASTFEQLQDRARKYGDAINRQRQLVNLRRKGK